MPKSRNLQHYRLRSKKYFLQLRKRYSRPKTRSRKRTGRAKFKMPLIYIALMIALGGFLLIRLINSSKYSFSSPDDTIVGKPSINAAFIDRVLRHYHSPAQGKGQILYNYGVQYGIDPAYALAFFLQESTFGTQGVAKITHSLGNIRATAGHPQYDGYRLYNTWEEGFADWYRLIADQYVNKWGLSTIDQIIPVYAPSSDNNDEALYIHTIKMAVNTWRNGIIEV